MKYLILITVILTSPAFCAVLYDNAVTAEAQITGDISFTTMGGTRDRWIAFDFRRASNCIVEGYSGHWIYFFGDSALGDINLEIFQGSSPGGTLITSFTVSAADIAESEWGTFEGNPVFWGEMSFGSDSFNCNGDTTYWIAAQMESSDNVFMAYREDSVPLDEWYWFGDGGFWMSSSDAHGVHADTSTKLTGTPSAVESVSLGAIKAIFK
ncbi:MAG: hypothetical protein GY771_08005 [bacterium]|nr:hypothetical protein [bacterium]